jgi:hypothetical protein
MAIIFRACGAPQIELTFVQSRLKRIFCLFPRVGAQRSDNPGLGLANAFGVIYTKV